MEKQTVPCLGYAMEIDLEMTWAVGRTIREMRSECPVCDRL